jgi:hypothetical protein
MTSVPVELLQQLTAALPSGGAPKSGRKPPTGFDLERWIRDHELDVDGPSEWQGGQRWIFRACPFNPEHRNRSAYVVQFPNGAIAAGCLHASCRGKNWPTLRDLVDPGWRNKATVTDEPLPPAERPPWEPPVPFDQLDLPPFPTAALPEPLRGFVECLATATQTPADLAGMLTLSAVAAAAAKKITVKLREG